LIDNPPLASLIVTPWYGGSHGGVAVATESLAHALIDAGSECAVLRLSPDGFFPRASVGRRGEEIVDVCVRHQAMAVGSIAQRAGYHARRRTAERTMRRLIDDHDIRIAHFHFFAGEFDILMQLARKAGLGVVTTFHGADINERLANPATRPVVEAMARFSDQITVVSRTLRDRLIQALPDVGPRVSLIPNVVPTSFAHATENDNRATSPLWDVLLVGQLIHRKGGDVLLDAMSQVIHDVPQARVAFAGIGDMESALRAQARRLGIESHVDFLGELSRDATLDAYRNSRIVAIPSRSEGLPLVLLEAQWLGIPVVASAVDGLPESIVDGEDGLLVPSDDPNALARGIARLLSDDTRYAEIGACARQHAREVFAPRVMVRALSTVYADAFQARCSVARPA
jgi:glycosyltransferase involved in cell wall biosynthesis